VQLLSQPAAQSTKEVSLHKPLQDKQPNMKGLLVSCRPIALIINIQLHSITMFKNRGSKLNVECFASLLKHTPTAACAIRLQRHLASAKAYLQQLALSQSGVSYQQQVDVATNGYLHACRQSTS
jgi:hypothetical protein